MGKVFCLKHPPTKQAIRQSKSTQDVAEFSGMESRLSYNDKHEQPDPDLGKPKRFSVEGSCVTQNN